MQHRFCTAVPLRCVRQLIDASVCAPTLRVRLAQRTVQALPLTVRRRMAMAPQEPSPHQILGVKRSASKEEIRERFRARAKLLHPDVNMHLDTAEVSEFTRQWAVWGVWCESWCSVACRGCAYPPLPPPRPPPPPPLPLSICFAHTYTHTYTHAYTHARDHTLFVLFLLPLRWAGAVHWNCGPQGNTVRCGASS